MDRLDFFSIDLLKLNVISIHDLSDKVVAMQNMFGALMGFWLFDLSNGSSAIVVEQYRTINGGCHFELIDKLSKPYSFLRGIR